MFSSTIWEKHARVSFSKTIKIARVRSWNAIEVFEKLMRTSVCFFELHEEPYYYLLIIYMKKLCSHVRKSHLVILKKIKKFKI
jgi:hypothetical protein